MVVGRSSPADSEIPASEYLRADHEESHQYGSEDRWVKGVELRMYE